MSYDRDLIIDLKDIMKIVFEIGKTNKFNDLDWKDVMTLATTIYDDYEYYVDGDIFRYAEMKLNEIIETEEMLL